MTSCYRATAIALVFVAAGSRASGAELPLSLDEALDRAAKASPLVVRARGAREVVAARRQGAAIVLPSNPVATVAVGAMQAGDAREGGVVIPGAVGAEWSLRLEQAVEVGGQRATRLAEVARATRAAEARERLALAETRARVRIAYVAGLLAARLVEAERLREGLADQLVASARARVDAGAAGDVELLMAEAERGRTSAARIQAETEEEARRSELRAITAVPPSEAVRLVTPLGPPEGEVPPLDALVRSALARRADLLALRADADEVDATIARLRRERVPSPTLFVDAFSQPEVGASPSELHIDGGIAIALPVARRNQGELAVARAERRRLDEEASLSERLVVEEVAVARQELLRRRAQLALFDGTIVPAAVREAALLRDGWRAGKFDLFRVIGAARDEASARREQLGALGALWQAAVTLQRATGALMDPSRGSLAAGGEDEAPMRGSRLKDLFVRHPRLAAMGVVAATVLALAVWIIRSSRETPSPTAAPARAADAGVALTPASLAKNPIVSVPVRRVRLRADVDLVGSAAYDGDRYAIVGPLVQGRVVAIRARPGDPVRVGQVLAEIESAEVGAAQAAYIAAAARSRMSETNERRERLLAEQRISSGRERELAEAQAAVDAAELRAAEQRLLALGLVADDIAALAEGRRRAGRVALRAPIAGSVIQRSITLGQAVEAATEAFHVADLGRLWVHLDVFEKDLDRVHVGQRALLRTESRPGETIPSRVAWIEPRVDVDTRTARVRIEFENADHRLRPGQFVTAHLEGEPRANAPAVLAVPRTAIATVEGRRVVFVEEAPGRWARRPVEVGATGGDLVEVSGVEEGERVVETGAFLLKSESQR